MRGSSGESSQRATSQPRDPAIAPVTPQCWHLGTSTADHSALCWPAPFQMEQPTWFLLIAGVHVYYEKMLGKSCFAVQICHLSAGNFRFWKYFPLEHRGKVQMLFEGNSMGTSEQPKHTLTAHTGHSGYRFPFCIGTVRFTTREEHLKGRCSAGMRQTCRTPLLSNCESPTDLPTVEVRTRLKSPSLWSYSLLEKWYWFSFEGRAQTVFADSLQWITLYYFCLEKFELLCVTESWPLPFLPFLCHALLTDAKALSLTYDLRVTLWSKKRTTQPYWIGQLLGKFREWKLLN